MKRLWVLLMPFLYLPNLGFERITPFGILALSDFLIGPYIVVVFFACKQKQGRKALYVDKLILLLTVFVYWATLSSLLINFRYGYNDIYHITFSLLKLGKLTLYGIAAILTIKALSNNNSGKIESWFHWSLLCAGCLVGVALFTSRDINITLRTINEIREQVYKDNEISAMMSILICYLGGLWLNQYGTSKWRLLSGLGLIIMLLGFFLAQGRGGWLAALVGAAYLIYQLNFTRALSSLTIVLGVLVFAYVQFPSFQVQIERTLYPDRDYLDRYNAGFAGLDDGKRVTIWIEEGQKLIESPLLGAGFFHRGYRSSLHPSGSHNFFIQMFLETGIIGGLLVGSIFYEMWHQTNQIVTKSIFVWPTKSALLATIIAGLGGEYFYGGMVLFTMLVVYGMVGCNSVPNTIQTNFAISARNKV